MLHIRNGNIALILFLVWMLTSCKSLNRHPISNVSDETTFNPNEFPNYFQEMINIEGFSIAEAIELLERASLSLAKRTVINVIESDTSAREERLLKNLAGKINSKHKGAKILLGGGGVRALWSYIYERIYLAKQNNQHVKVSDLLSRIAADTTLHPSREILGNGSDIDLYFTAPSSRQLQDTISTGQNYISEIDRANKLDDLAEPLRRVFGFRADVKEYKSQIKRSTEQGGAALDFLALDLTTGEIIEPDGDKSIRESFLKGHYEYYPPKRISALTDPLATYIRAHRPLLEIPCLSFSGASTEEPFRARNHLETLLRGGYQPTERELQQYEKMQNNARFNGAHNRLYRSEAGTPEASFLEFSRRFDKPGAPMLREYVDHFSIGQRRSLNGLPRSALLGARQFIDRFTVNGSIYHGTPSILSGLSLLRGGMFVSNEKQGIAVFGRGGYTTNDTNLASSYAGMDGLTLELKVNPATVDNLNIIDWESVKNDEFFTQAAAEAKKNKTHVFEYLSRRHGIDIIIADSAKKSKIILVQNTAPFRFPTKLADLLVPLRLQVFYERIDVTKRARALGLYQNLKKYVKLVENHDGQPIPRSLQNNIANDLFRKYPQMKHDDRLGMIHTLPYIEAVQPEKVKTFLLEKMSDLSSHPGVRKNAIEAYASLKQVASNEIVSKLRGIINSGRDPDSHGSCLKSLTKFTSEYPNLYRYILSQSRKIKYRFFTIVKHLALNNPGFWDRRANVSAMIEVSRSHGERANILTSLAWYNAPEDMLIEELKAVYPTTEKKGRKRIEIAGYLAKMNFVTTETLSDGFEGLFEPHAFGTQEEALNFLSLLNNPPKWVKGQLSRFATSTEDGIGQKSLRDKALAIIEVWEENQKIGVKQDAVVTVSLSDNRKKSNPLESETSTTNETENRGLIRRSLDACTRLWLRLTRRR